MFRATPPVQSVSVAAPQSGSPPSYNGASATPALNVYSSTITVLDGAANGSRRVFRFVPPVPNGAPTNLTFSNVAAATLTASWADNSTNENGFAIYASSDGGATFNFAAAAGRNQTSATIGNLTANTNYVFRVFAVTEGALSAAAENAQTTDAPGNFVSILAGGNWSNPATRQNNAVPTVNDGVTIAAGATVVADAPANAAYNIQSTARSNFPRLKTRF